MSSTQVQLIGGSFQDPQGNFLANGKLTLTLDQDIQVNGEIQVCAGLTVEAPLDENANIIGSPPVYAWANDTGSPINTWYTVCGYSESGQLAWGSNQQQILYGSPPTGTFDVGSWIPNLLSYWIPPVQPVLFETNGVPNYSQSELNLIQGEGMTIVNTTGGNIVFTSGSAPANPYDIIFSLPGSTPGPETLGIMVFTRSVMLPENFTGSTGHVGHDPTAPSTWVLNHNDVSFGQFVIGTQGDFTFSSSSEQVFSPDDWLTVTLPAADETLADVLFTLAGTR